MSFTYFMDDSGDSNLLSRRHNFWVLGGIAMPDDSWPHISTSLRALRLRWRIPEKRELKWQDVGRRIGEINNPIFRARDPELSVAHIDSIDDLEQLAREMMMIVAEDDAIRVLSVVCVKSDAMRVCGGAGDKNAVNERCYADMFNDAIERYEYFLTTLGNRDGVFGHIVVDEKSRHFDNVLREVCDELLAHGTRFADIEHVIGGLNVSPSHHSHGLQVADFVAGAIHRWFEKEDDRYLQVIHENLHSDYMGDVIGAGIKRYPSRGTLDLPVWREQPAPIQQRRRRA
jgi:hypothetical protein